MASVTKDSSFSSPEEQQQQRVMSLCDEGAERSDTAPSVVGSGAAPSPTGLQNAAADAAAGPGNGISSGVIIRVPTITHSVPNGKDVGDDEEAWGRGSIPRQMAAKQLSVKASSVYGTDHNGEAESESCGRKFSSCRWVLGYLCCMARFSQSAIRQCIGMAVVCMTLHSGQEPSRPGSTAASASHVTGWEFHHGGTLSLGNNYTSQTTVSVSAAYSNGAKLAAKIAAFSWSPEFEGLILNGFNIGFFFSPIIGGYIAGVFGGKRVVLVALLAGSIATICLPIAARSEVILVMVLRVVAGVFLGMVDPAIQALWAQWAPKFEKAQLTTCSYTGLSLAGIVTFFISGHLCGIDAENGWAFIFYFFGGFTFICTIPWMFLVYDSPEKHPRIQHSELKLIAKGKNPEATGKTMKTPWKQILTSGPFWAIVVAHCTYTWVTSWMMSYLPKYLSDILKFGVEEDGLYSSLPYIGRLVVGIFCSFLSDKLQRSGIFSTGGCRKLFQVIGCAGCAASTLGVGFLDHTARHAAVVLLVLSMSFQNVTSVAFRINHLDIAPRFAGVMMGMTVTVAVAFSLTGPPITAAIIRQGTHEEWLIMFSIVAALNIIGAIFFCIFGSGEIQDWALLPVNSNNQIVSVVTVNSPNTLPSEHKENDTAGVSTETDGVHEQVEWGFDTDGAEYLSHASAQPPSAELCEPLATEQYQQSDREQLGSTTNMTASDHGLNQDSKTPSREQSPAVYANPLSEQ